MIQNGMMKVDIRSLVTPDPFQTFWRQFVERVRKKEAAEEEEEATTRRTRAQKSEVTWATHSGERRNAKTVLSD